MPQIGIAGRGGATVPSDADASTKGILKLAGDLGGTAALPTVPRLAPVINVKTYGAVGDGVADDTAAIQAALDAVTVPGGVVYFPYGGIYKITSGLTSSTPNIELRGAGGPGAWAAVGLGATQIVVPAGVVGFTFNPSAASELFQAPVIRGIQFVLAATATAGVRIKRCRGFLIDDCSVTGGSTSGIGVDIGAAASGVVEYGVLRNVKVSNCLVGVRQTGCNGIRHESCDYEGNSNGTTPAAGSTGVQIVSGDTTTIIGTSLHGWEKPVDMQAGEGHRTLGCRFEDFTTGITYGATTVGCAEFGSTFNNNQNASGGTALSVAAGAIDIVLFPASIVAVATRLTNLGTRTVALVPGNNSAGAGRFLVNEIDLGDSSHTITYGTGSPEGVVTANIGSLFIRTDGGAGTSLYKKESGSGNTGWVADQVFYPYRVAVGIFAPSKAQVGTSWGIAASTVSIGNGVLNSNALGGSAQNDSIDFEVLLGAGTWNLTTLTIKDVNKGIITVSLDDGAGSFTTLGTIDTYAAATTNNVADSITGFVVASSIPRTLRLKMATKNASSSAYTLNLVALNLRRTA